MYINKINGHSYIGKAKNFNKRHKEHVNNSKNKKAKDYNYPFHKAIRKYGIDNFEIKILAENVSEEKIGDYEIFFIERYKSLKTQNGYNIAKGGINCNNNFEGKTDEEMNEIRNNMSKNHADVKGKNNPMYGVHRYGENAPMYGKLHSEESKKKISKSKRKIIVVRYSLDGILIDINYQYIYEKMGFDRSSIRRCCTGKQKTVSKRKGSEKFIFKYAEDDFK